MMKVGPAATWKERKMMKTMKALLALVLLAVAVGGADAAMLLRQNGDGTASWVNTTDDRSHSVGETYLTIVLENLSLNNTTYVHVPIASQLTAVDLVANGLISTATDTITIWVEQVTSGVYVSAGTISVGHVGAATGDQDAASLTATASVVLEDGLIAIHQDGASSADVDASLTLTIRR